MHLILPGFINGEYFQPENSAAMAKVLVGHPKTNVNVVCHGAFCTPLIYAIMWKDRGVMRELLNHPSIDVNSRDEYGRTPL